MEIGDGASNRNSKGQVVLQLKSAYASSRIWLHSTSRRETKIFTEHRANDRSKRWLKSSRPGTKLPDCDEFGPVRIRGIL